jgi:hypothetical protein
MIWILMILDIVAFVALSLAHFDVAFPATLLFLSAGYLIGKGFVFRDIMSALDLIAGIYILIVILFGVSNFMYYIIFVWFMYKFVFTLTAV